MFLSLLSGWHPVIAEAEGYDIIATKGTHMLRIQVKSSSGPIIGKRERAPGYYRWTAGLGGNKQLGTPTESYDVLALCALGSDAITFLYASDVTRKTSELDQGISMNEPAKTPGQASPESSTEKCLFCSNVLQVVYHHGSGHCLKCGQKVDPCCTGAPLDQTQLIQDFEE